MTAEAASVATARPRQPPPTGLSLGLTSFLKGKHSPLNGSASAPPGSPNGCPSFYPLAQCSIEEHNRRSSLSATQLREALQLHSLSTTTTTTGRAASPDSRTVAPPTPVEAILALYPPPPHLTPQPSPSTSPRGSLRIPRGRGSGSSSDDGCLSTTHLIGKLTIRVVEARNLACIHGNEKPYCLLHSVSREYGALPPPPTTTTTTPKRGGKKSSPNGVGLGKGNRPGLRQVRSSQVVTTVRRNVDAKARPPESSSNSNVLDPITDGTEVEGEAPDKPRGTPDAPVWDHVAQFDVVQPGRTILLCIYDKLAPIGGYPAHGFLGASVFEAPLSHELGPDGFGIDVWVPLTSVAAPDTVGEVRLRILFETLQVLKMIGQGSFGSVFKVRKKDTKRIYAMKVITKESVASRSALSQVLAERQVLARTLDSPFLVGLKFSFQNPNDLFFVMDFKGGGELFGHLQKDGGRFEESRVRFYVCEIVLALEYLHDHGIIYRDLKPENCLLDGSGHCVLVDFGLSKLLSSPDDSTRTLCGTTAFMAPEVLLDVGYNYRCDWWSLGCLLYEMCYGFSPFYAESKVEEYERILGGEIKIPTKRGYSPDSRDLLLKLLTREPNDRIGARGGAREIKAHAFFSEVDWQRVALRQYSPPYKPPAVPDDEDCLDRGRNGEWMFSSDGGASRRGSRDDREQLEQDGIFRDFTFTAVPRSEGEPEYGANGRRSSWSGAMP